MWTIFKVFIEFVIISFLFYVFFFFGFEACGILLLHQGSTGITFPVLESQVLTTELPDQSQDELIFMKHLKSCLVADKCYVNMY